MSTGIREDTRSFKRVVVGTFQWISFSAAAMVPLHAVASPQSSLRFEKYEAPAVSKMLAAPVESLPSAASWVKDLEAQLGMTKSGLAALLSVSRPTLYAWSRGEKLRESSARRLRDLRGAVQALVEAAPNRTLPPLWQHQKLPNGVSFAEGMRQGYAADELALGLIELWKRDSRESAAIEHLFKRG